MTFANDFVYENAEGQYLFYPNVNDNGRQVLPPPSRILRELRRGGVPLSRTQAMSWGVWPRRILYLGHLSHQHA